MASIRPSSRTDLAQLAVTGWRAFADDPVVRWFFPEDDDYVAVGREMFGWVLRRATRCRHCGARMTVLHSPDGHHQVGQNPSPMQSDPKMTALTLRGGCSDTSPTAPSQWRTRRLSRTGT